MIRPVSFGSVDIRRAERKQLVEDSVLVEIKTDSHNAHITTSGQMLRDDQFVIRAMLNHSGGDNPEILDQDIKTSKYAEELAKLHREKTPAQLQEEDELTRIKALIIELFLSDEHVNDRAGEKAQLNKATIEAVPTEDNNVFQYRVSEPIGIATPI